MLSASLNKAFPSFLPSIAVPSLEFLARARKAFLFSPFTLICKVTAVAESSYSIRIFNKYSVDFFTTIDQHPGRCSVFKHPPTGYRSMCGTGSDDLSSNRKEYYVVIGGVRNIDETDWWCTMDSPYVRSNTFTLEVKRKIQTVQTVNVGEEREMFYLTTHSTHFICGYMASDIWATLSD